MAGRGQNQGFHVLDEFVCEAMSSPPNHQADPTIQDRQEGSDTARAERLLGELRALAASYPDDAAVRENLSKGLFNALANAGMPVVEEIEIDASGDGRLKAPDST
jgi:hypothetical protein